jgi:hypothetical protein
LSYPEDTTNWEIILGLGSVARGERLNWLLSVRFFNKSLQTCTQSDQFLPEDSYDSSDSSFSSTSSGASFGSRTYFRSNTSRNNLINQLTTSPETRFHAAWMFLRYHSLLGLSRNRKVTADQLPLYAGPGIWDVALASLAISIKVGLDSVYQLCLVLTQC